MTIIFCLNWPSLLRVWYKKQLSLFANCFLGGRYRWTHLSPTVCLSVHSCCLSICLWLYYLYLLNLSVWLFFLHSVCLFFFPSFCLFVGFSFSLISCLSAGLSVCLSVCWAHFRWLNKGRVTGGCITGGCVNIFFWLCLNLNNFSAHSKGSSPSIPKGYECNGLNVEMNRTSSNPKSVLGYVLDKGQYFHLETSFTQSCFPNKNTRETGDMNTGCTWFSDSHTMPVDLETYCKHNLYGIEI